MYKKGAVNDKQGKDAGNRTLCPYRNFSQAIMIRAHWDQGIFIVGAGVDFWWRASAKHRGFSLHVWRGKNFLLALIEAQK